MGGLISAGTSLLGGQAQADAIRYAADKQAQTAQQSIDTQRDFYDQTQQRFAPYLAYGNNALGTLSGRLNELTAPINMDQATLEATPGYKWNLAQGLKASTSMNAAKGLGMSGALLKGANTFAAGLADNTYNTQWQMAKQNQTDTYNKLFGGAQLGQSSAANVGAAGITTGQGVGATLNGLGNSLGAASIAGGKAAAGTYNGVGAGLYQSLNNNGGISGIGNQLGSWFGGSGSGNNVSSEGWV